jgi:hypothetical protein
MGILDVTSFTREGWIHLTVYVNSQNSRVLSANNPHETKATPEGWYVVRHITK